MNSPEPDVTSPEPSEDTPSESDEASPEPSEDAPSESAVTSPEPSDTSSESDVASSVQEPPLLDAGLSSEAPASITSLLRPKLDGGLGSVTGGGGGSSGWIPYQDSEAPWPELADPEQDWPGKTTPVAADCGRQGTQMPPSQKCWEAKRSFCPPDFSIPYRLSLATVNNFLKQTGAVSH